MMGDPLPHHLTIEAMRPMGYLKFCPECGLNAQRRSKAPIMQHIEANATGETVVMDLLHYPKAKGHK